MSDFQFAIQTCEERASGAICRPLEPRAAAPYAPFRVGDPFGLRKAVYPIFLRTPSGELFGLGTAFHVDGWGGGLTAEHVVDVLRVGLPGEGLAWRDDNFIDPSQSDHAVALLGLGLVIGRVALPAWALAPVVGIGIRTRERNDPLAELRGRRRFEVAADVASLQMAMSREAFERKGPPKTIALQQVGWLPTIGEKVIALGYPELKPSATVSAGSMRTMIEDGLFAACGAITGVFPEGRDLANPTPAFEVSANWPSGMSGGPVINQAGNVVGLVSRSLAPDGEGPGVGWAACLSWIHGLDELLPTVDWEVSGFRRGYAVYDEELQDVLEFLPTRALAEHRAASHGIGFTVFACSNRIGTDDWIRSD